VSNSGNTGSFYRNEVFTGDEPDGRIAAIKENLGLRPRSAPRSEALASKG
jgi:hypothetical protein